MTEETKKPEVVKSVLEELYKKLNIYKTKHTKAIQQLNMARDVAVKLEGAMDYINIEINIELKKQEVK